jgi:hypothetical protein
MTVNLHYSRPGEEEEHSEKYYEDHHEKLDAREANLKTNLSFHGLALHF